MDILTQKNMLLKLVLVLIVLNLLLLGYCGWKAMYHPQPQDRNQPVPQSELSELLKKELGLTPEQADSLKKIRADFFDQEIIISEETRKKRDSMNELMFHTNANDSLLKQLAAGVAANEYKMEVLRIEQAAKMRSLCKPDQLKKLNKLVKEVRDYLKPAPVNK